MHIKKGFTLVELLLSLSILMLFSLLILPLLPQIQLERYQFSYEYLMHQSQCMAERTSHELETAFDARHPYWIHFNNKGHVNMAQTVTFTGHNRFHEVVIQLGGGRLVFR